jgi:hypothetical protein
MNRKERWWEAHHNKASICTMRQGTTMMNAWTLPRNCIYKRSLEWRPAGAHSHAESGQQMARAEHKKMSRASMTDRSKFCMLGQGWPALLTKTAPLVLQPR